MYKPGCVSLLICRSIIGLLDGAPKYTKHDGHKGDKLELNSSEKCTFMNSLFFLIHRNHNNLSISN